MFLEVNRIKRISRPRHLFYCTRSNFNIARQNGYAKQNIIRLHFQQINRAANYQELGKKRKPFCTQGTIIRENAELSPTRQSKAGIITFIQNTSFGRKNSNKASSSSNVDSVVGCSLKLFRSLARDCLATLPKGNVKAEIRDYIVCYEHCNCNRFLISCGRCSQLSSLLQCSFSEDVGVTNRRPS